MKIILKVLSIIQIIAGIVLVLEGVKGRAYHAALPGALLIISGSFLLYLLFMRSEKD